MFLYDAHTHLNQEQLFPHREEYLFQFLAAGGKGLVNAGANAEYNARGIEIAQRSQQKFPDAWVKCTLGYHPCDVKEIGMSVEDSKKELKNQIIEHQDLVVAIGECGIDLHYDSIGESLELQREVFVVQCELAREVGLPLVIHSRDAFQETLDILKNYPDLTIYFHCWGYGKEEIQTLDTLFPNLFIGFCGNISYPKAEALRESLRAIAKEKILIETDAPYLSPQPFRGQTNFPQNVKVIGSTLAQVLETTEEALWEQIEKNFWKLYKK